MKTTLTALLIALSLAVATMVYSYGATTSTLRVRLPFIKKNTALAILGNFGLKNGSFATWAKVDNADNESGSFGNEIVFSRSYDSGPYHNSGTAYAYVNGYDGDDKFQQDHDYDSN